MPNRLLAACDGACKGNPGPAAWGWVVADVDEQVLKWAAGPLGDATNNIAELTALRELLSETDPAVELEVRMDSQYAINAVTTWLPGWKKNGWVNAAKKPVANKELIQSIDALLAGRTVKFVHVAAHQVDGDRLNDLADRAASAVAASQSAVRGTNADEVPETPDEIEPRARWKSAAKSTKKSSGPSGLTAKFAGKCSCGRPYKAGDKIAKSATGWGHPECAAN